MTKFATDLPKPRRRTAEDLEQIDREARETVRAVSEGTRTLEEMPENVMLD